MAEGDEYSGRTVDDAIARAEGQLGVGRDDLVIDVVTQGSRGIFGIGAEDAVIRARRREAEAEPATDAPAQSVTTEVALMERPNASPPDLQTGPGTPSANGSDLAAEASQVLRELLRSMGFDAAVSVRSSSDPIMVAITGSNLGVLIGRRGDNLAALQFMVNLILSKNRRQWPRIVIDVENYRARREESLRTLADRIAYRVTRNQRPFTLEAMAAGDRRVIHLALRERSDIETYSIGEGASRRVVIAPKRESNRAAERYS